MISYYHRVARRTRLCHDIFDSLNSSKNEDVKTVNAVVGSNLMVVEHVRELAFVIRIPKLPVENKLEHTVQSVNSVTSLSGVLAQNEAFNQEIWLVVLIWSGTIVGEFNAVGFQEMSQDENVGFDVSDEPVI